MNWIWWLGWCYRCRWMGAGKFGQSDGGSRDRPGSTPCCKQGRGRPWPHPGGSPIVSDPGPLPGFLMDMDKAVELQLGFSGLCLRQQFYRRWGWWRRSKRMRTRAAGRGARADTWTGSWRSRSRWIPMRGRSNKEQVVAKGASRSRKD